MRIVDALVEVLKDNDSLTYKEAYEKIRERDLYKFGAKDPETAVNAKLRCHCEGLDFPGASPVKYFTIVGKKGTRNLYGLIKDDKHTEVTSEKTVNIASNADLLPEEKIENAYQSYKVALKKQIIDHIMDCHPSFFEQLVVDLLLAMGYGSDDLSGKAIGKSHDGGIDGIIYEDEFGLSKICIQAKRYDSSNKIGNEPLQKFVGAMQSIQKGVFITTSSFTKSALAFAKEQQQKSLKLIDGDLLAELMIKYGIGLEAVQTYTIYKINEDFYE